VATSIPEHSEPRRRADAVRNRARVLDAAAAAFAEHGSAVSIEQIAREADVGAGTIYRHFANRDALLAAIVARRMEEVTAWAREREGSPADVLFDFVDMMGRSAVADGGLADALAEANSAGDALAASEADFMVLLDGLVAAAVSSGELHRDVSARAIKAMIVGQQWVARTGDVAAAAAHLAVLQRGARTAAGTAS
jgi:AcrR family transcriptional regulator